MGNIGKIGNMTNFGKFEIGKCREKLKYENLENTKLKDIRDIESVKNSENMKLKNIREIGCIEILKI